MIEGLQKIVEIEKVAFENLQWYVLVYLICLILIAFFGGRLYRRTFLFPVLLLGLTVYNPLLIVPLAQRFSSVDSRIRRIFWLLPVELVLSVISAVLIVRLGKLWKQIVVTLALIVLISVAGLSVLTGYHKADNLQKLDAECVTLAQAIEQDIGRERYSSDATCICYASPYLEQIREYDPALSCVISREDILRWDGNQLTEDKVNEILDAQNPQQILDLALQFGILIDPDEFSWAVSRLGVQYIICTNSTTGIQEYLSDLYYTPITETQQYTLYRVSDRTCRIYFVRHGETVGNAEGRLTGARHDYALTQHGIDAAESAGRLLSDVSFAAVYTSQLDRTLRTAEIILGEKSSWTGSGIVSENLSDAAPGTIVRLAGLNDVDWGTIEGETWADVKAEYGSDDGAAYLGSGSDASFVSPVGAETQHEYDLRFDRTMRSIVAQSGTEEPVGTVSEDAGASILICTHSAVAMWLSDLTGNDSYTGLLPAALTELTYQRGRWTVISFNRQ